MKIQEMRDNLINAEFAAMIQESCTNHVQPGVIDALVSQPMAGIYLFQLREPVDWQHAADRETTLKTMYLTMPLTWVNATALHQFRAIERIGLIGRSPADLYGDLSDESSQSWFQLFELGELRQEVKIIRHDQTSAWMMIDSVCLYNEHGQLIGVLAIQIDISRQRQSESELRDSRDLYRLLTEFSLDTVWRYNVQRNALTYVSPAVTQLLGYPVADALRLSHRELTDPYQRPHLLDLFGQYLERFLRYGEQPLHPYLELQLQHRDGHPVWSEIAYRFRLNEQKELELIGSARNIEDRKKHESRILYLSYHDQMTHLYNRHFYSAELQRLDVPRNLPIAMILSDINGLKATNDIFGHTTGDTLLIAYADILRQACRADDIIARIGGDEFIVLLPNTGQEQVMMIRDRIMQLIDQKKLAQSVLSVSCGIAVKTLPDQIFAEQFIKAEEEMYHQKMRDRRGFERRLATHIRQQLAIRDPREKERSERIGQICQQLAVQSGLTREEIRLAGLAGRLHDIGKIAIDQRILMKKEPLNDDDWREIQRHVEIGYQIAKNIHHYADVAEIILTHHERPDGLGYPRGLRQHEIPLISRMVSVAVAFDAMLHKKNMSSFQAMNELEKGAGSQFDPAVVALFRRFLAQSKPLKI